MEKMEKSQEQRKGFLCCLLAGAAWGFSGVCGQFLFDTRFWSVDFLIPVRMLLAGVFLMLLARKVEGGAGFRKLVENRHNMLDLLVFGVLGLGLCQYSYYSTIRAANAATATVLCYLGPVLIILWQALRQRRMPEGKEILAVAVAVAGTFLLATHGDSTSLAMSPVALFWGVVSALASAVYSIQPRRLIGACGTLTATGCGMLLAGVFLCLLRQPWAHLAGVFDFAAFLAFGAVVFIGSILCFALYFSGVKRIGPTRGSILSATEPLVSTVLSVVWLRVAFYPMDYLGFALIVSTIFLLALPTKRRNAENAV